MAFFDSDYSASRAAFNVVGVEADNADKLETDLLAAITAAGTPASVADIDLGGAGAGPRWHAYATMANTVSGPKGVAKANVRLAAAVAGNPAQAQLAAVTKLNALAPTNIVKVVVAGAGVGPTYMALAVGEA